MRYGPTAGQAVACGAAHNLAALWTYRSLPTAIEWQQRALRLAEIEGDRRITAVNRARLGLLHLVGGDPSAAAEPITRAAELMTGRVTARWEDTVTFARALLLEWQDAAIRGGSRLSRPAHVSARRRTPAARRARLLRAWPTC